MPNSSIIHSFYRAALNRQTVWIPPPFPWPFQGYSLSCLLESHLYAEHWLSSMQHCQHQDAILFNKTQSTIPVTPRSLHQNEDQKKHLTSAGWVVCFLVFLLVIRYFLIDAQSYYICDAKLQDISALPPSSRNNCIRAFLVQSSEASNTSSLLTTFPQLNLKVCLHWYAKIKTVQLLHRSKTILLKGLLFLDILSVCIQLYRVTQSEGPQIGTDGLPGNHLHIIYFEIFTVHSPTLIQEAKS